MKVLIISPKNRTVYNFRGDLIKAMQEKSYEVIVTGPDRIDADKIEELGVKFHEIAVDKNGTSIIGNLKYMKTLLSLMKKEKPDVTLGYTVKPVVYGAIAAKLAGVKNINSMITGGGYTFVSKTLKAKVLGIIVRLLYRIGLCCSNHVIFQNPDDMKEFLSLKMLNEKKCGLVNGSGVNLKRFEATPFPNRIRFLTISRLLKSKGVCEYLEAAKKVKEEYPDVEFGLLGKFETAMQDGIPKEYIQPFIDSNVVTRYEETNDVRPYYQQCSVYVLPSYREGTPRTVLEAMACGRAIITTDAIGCRETVIDKYNGFLVPLKDIDTLADRMKWCINNPDEVQKMGKASLEYCRSKYDVDKVNKEMIRIMNM